MAAEGQTTGTLTTSIAVSGCYFEPLCAARHRQGSRRSAGRRGAISGPRRFSSTGEKWEQLRSPSSNTQWRDLCCPGLPPRQDSRDLDSTQTAGPAETSGTAWGRSC